MKTLCRLIIFLSLINFINTSCQKKYLCEDCGSANQLPIANAGDDQTFNLPKDSTSLNAGGSLDADGTIVSYQWQKIAGPNSFFIKDANAAESIVRSLSAGRYQFEVKVTDNKGGVSKDTLLITVNEVDAINHAPIASAGIDQTILPHSTATLNGSASADQDNNIVSYTWLKIEGPPVTISDAHAIQTQITDVTQGIYFFELTVTDGSGLSSRDTVKITVSAYINTGEIIITAPLNYVYLDGSNNWDNNTDCIWQQVSGPSIVLLDDARTPIPWVQNLVPGVYIFRLETHDPKSVLTITVTVVKDALEKNTVTYKKLRWITGNVYGAGMDFIHIFKPDWLERRPIEVYLNIGPGLQWFKVPSVQNTENYKVEGDSHRLWIVRTPYDQSWIGKESDIKVQFL